MHFVPPERANLRRGDFYYCNRQTIEGGELDHKTLAAFVNVDDSTNVIRDQPMLRQVRSQRNAIQFANHPCKGYAVMKRGASSPLSISQTVRTRGWRPDGVFIVPSIRDSCIAWRK